MDPAKLKVVELRAELQARGLDTKGNKPVLVKRLKEALEAELQTDLPDTSIADTSTEDCGSQDDECMVDLPSKPAQVESDADSQVSQSNSATELELPVPEVAVVPEVSDIPKEPEPVPEPEPEPKPEVIPEVENITETPAPASKDVEEMETNVEEPLVTEPAKEEQQLQPEPATEPEVQPQPTENVAQEEPIPEEVPQEKVEQNGNNTNGDTEEDVCEPKAKKSRWGSDTEAAVATINNEASPAVADEAAPKEQKEERGDKRKHSSPSPERNQRARSKSPIREDEPVVDANKVQLSWYDSDLHLQIDKTSFLSAKPFNDGLFGYIWSGARVTHGVKANNKGCYEVKVTEELPFEDILSTYDRRENRRDRRDSRREDRGRSRAKSENESEKNKSTVKPDEKPAQESEEKSEFETKPDAAQPVEENATTEVENVNTEEASDAAVKETPKESADQPTDEQTAPTEQTSKIPTTEEKPEVEPEVELVKVAPHIIRIGWSSAKSSLQLGEDKHSYGLESSGKFYANKTAVSTDATFKVGDVVRAFIDMTTHELIYAINGTVAFKYQIELSEEENSENFTLFPHVLTRNLAFEVNLGDKEEAMSTTPEGYDDYSFVSKLEEPVSGPKTPETREQCEVIMMCGLPGAGKTHWVKEHLSTATKNYNIVGTSFLMDRMTVDGNSIRTSICPGRLSFFWNKLQKAISRICEIAPLRRRDFILDQTNVFPTAIRRKMRSFLGFKRHAVIVVNDDEEQEKRMKQQDPEAGKDMSVSALLEMKANMGLPKVGENLELVTYASLPEDKALEQVEKYNKQGREGGYGNIGHHKRDHRDDRNNRWHNRGSGGGPRRDYQNRNNYRDRPYQVNRYDRNYRQGSGGSGNNWRPGGGGGGGGGGNWMSRNNDRRDNRGPRDWRNNNRSGGLNDRPQHRGGGGGGNRDNRSHSNNSGGNYNRNRNQSSSSGGGRWGGQSGGGSWSSQSGGGSWNSGSQGQDWNSGWNQSQGSWNQNQWKYGGGYNQGGYSQYPQNWNSYYGGSNYSQDWGGSNTGAHGQTGSSAQGGASSTTNTPNSNSSYASSSSMMAPQQQQQQAVWAQYAQQYTQGTTSNDNSQK